MRGRIGDRRKAPWAVAAVAAFAAFAAPSASAITVSNVQATPASTQAGANSNLDLAFDVGGGSLKDLVIHLPPGLVGNPLATTTCTETQLQADACPPASDVGDIENDVVIGMLAPSTATGQVYNVVPRQGEPARFGFVLNAPPADKIVLQSAAVLRPTDLGLDTVLNNVPNTATVLGIPVPITISAVRLKLLGQVGAPPQGFLRNPTSCGTNTVSIDVTGYDSSTGTASDTFDTVNCAALPFTPEFKASIIQTANPADAVELSTTISQTIDEAGLKRASVTLPASVSGDGVALTNLCPVASFDSETCPASTVVGDAVAASPLQSEPLKGNVYLIPSSLSSLPAIGVDLRGSLGLKLKGALALNSELRPVVVFDGLPDIPISEFTLTFAGGPNGVNDAAPDLCGLNPPPTFNTSFLAHSGTTLDLATPSAVECIKKKSKKKPKATVKLGKLSSAQPSLTLKIKAGAAKLRSAKLKLPKGLSFDGDAGASAKADGKALKGKGLKLGSRSLGLKVKGKGAKNLVAKVAKGTLVRSTTLGPEKKLKFKLKLRDATGKSTKLTLRPK